MNDKDSTESFLFLSDNGFQNNETNKNEGNKLDFSNFSMNQNKLSKYKDRVFNILYVPKIIHYQPSILKFKYKKGQKTLGRNISLPLLNHANNINISNQGPSKITFIHNESIKKKNTELMKSFTKAKQDLLPSISPIMSQNEFISIENRILKYQTKEEKPQLLFENATNSISLDGQKQLYFRIVSKNQFIPLNIGFYNFSKEKINCFFSLFKKRPTKEINDLFINQITPNKKYKLFFSNNRGMVFHSQFINLGLESNTKINLDIAYAFGIESKQKIFEAPRIASNRILEEMKKGNVSQINKKISFFLENQSELNLLYKRADEIKKTKKSNLKDLKDLKNLKKAKSKRKMESISKIKLNIKSINSLQNLKNQSEDGKINEYKLTTTSALKRKNQLLIKKIVLNTLDYHRWDLKRTQDHLVTQYNNNKSAQDKIFKAWLTIYEEISIFFYIFILYKKKKKKIMKLLRFNVCCLVLKLSLLRRKRKIGKTIEFRTLIFGKLNFQLIHFSTYITINDQSRKIIVNFLRDSFSLKKLLNAAIFKLEKMKIYKEKIKSYVENMNWKLNKILKFFEYKKGEIISKINMNFKDKDKQKKNLFEAKINNINQEEILTALRKYLWKVDNKYIFDMNLLKNCNLQKKKKTDEREQKISIGHNSTNSIISNDSNISDKESRPSLYKYMPTSQQLTEIIINLVN